MTTIQPCDCPTQVIAHGGLPRSDGQRQGVDSVRGPPFHDAARCNRSCAVRARARSLAVPAPAGWTRPSTFAALSQCPVQIDDRLCNHRRGLARMTPGASGLFRRPAWISGLVALFPLVKPTLRARQLAADLLDFVPGKISRYRVLSALFLGVGHSDLLGSLLLWVAVCRLFSMSWHNPSLSEPLYGC